MKSPRCSEGCAFGGHGAGLQESTVDSSLKVSVPHLSDPGTVPDPFTST